MTGSARGSRRFGLALGVVALLAFALRVAYVLWVAPDELGFDALWYQLQAETLAAGAGYVDPEAFFSSGLAVPTANFPPLWPVLLAGATEVGLDTVRAHQLVGAAIGSLTVVVTGVIGRRVCSSAAGVVAAALVAVSPALVAADGSLMADSLYVLLATLAVLACYRALGNTSARWMWFAALGALLGLACLARSDALLLAPLLIAATAWKVPTSATHRLALGVLAAAVVAAVLSPWVVRNAQQMDEPVLLSSNSGSVLEGANCASTYGGRLLGAWDPACLRATRDPGRDELEWAAAGRQAGIDHAGDHVARLPLVGAARVLRAWGVWHPLDQADLEAVETRRHGWQAVAVVTTAGLLALAVPGARRLVRGPTTIAPMVAVAAGATLAALSAWGNTRFTLAGQPMLACAAAAVLADRVPLAGRVGRDQPSSDPTTETNETISPG